MLETVPPEKRLEYLDQQLNQKRQVKLKTCADVYGYWRHCKRLYKKAPKDGVEFQVDYIDTGLALSEGLRSSAPIALALHGAPGSYHDFALLIHHLTQQNVRVIAPNFPEYTATVKTKVLFRHSADEKAAYLRDFLKAINVNKIDLLVSHSSAIFPTLLILLNANNEAIAKQQQQFNHPSDGKDKNSKSASIKDVSTTTIANWRNNINSEDNCLNNSKGNEELDDDDKFEDAKDSVDNNNNDNKHLDSNSGNRRQPEADSGKQPQQHHGQSMQDGGVGKRSKRRQMKQHHQKSSQDVIVKFDQPIEIKAVALFNPAGHRLPKSMKPTWFKCGSVRIYQHKLGRSLFRKLGPAFLTVVGVPVRVDNMDNVMLSATVMRNSRCQRVVKQLEQLSQLKLPTLLVFSENDKLIEKEIFYEMTQFMKLDRKNFDIFNNDGNIELSQSLTEDWIRVMVFKAGGHYAYSNYAKTVNKAVSELLDRVVKEPSTRRQSLQETDAHDNR